MLNQRLVAEVARRAKNPVDRSPQAESVVFATMAAESLRLEGIDTSAEDVLDAVKTTEAQRAHATAS